MKKIFNAVRLFLHETDKFLLFSAVLTSVYGLLTVYSATRCTLKEGELFSRDFIIMLIAVVLGIALCLCISYFN